MRIEFIDKLKGFAIFLVVMGHITEKSLGINNTPFNLFYSSFHMPLFMFLSGVFAFKTFKCYDMKEFLMFFKKKALRILVPFAVVGGGFSILAYGLRIDDWTVAIGGYWFLPALFYCMLVGSLTHILRYRFGKSNMVAELGIELTVLTVLSIAYYVHVLDSVPFYLHFIKMYPFFVLGTFFSPHERFRDRLMKNEMWLAVSVVAYIISFILPSMPVNIHAFFAIVIWVQFFARYSSKIPRVISVMGFYSMEIYVFHWFLLPQLSGFRAFFISQPGMTLANGNFVLLVMVNSAIALCIVALCIMIAKLISCSRLLHQLCLGTI